MTCQTVPPAVNRFKPTTRRSGRITRKNAVTNLRMGPPFSPDHQSPNQVHQKDHSTHHSAANQSQITESIQKQNLQPNPNRSIPRYGKSTKQTRSNSNSQFLLNDRPKSPRLSLLLKPSTLTHLIQQTLKAATQFLLHIFTFFVTHNVMKTTVDTCTIVLLPALCDGFG